MNEDVKFFMWMFLACAVGGFAGASLAVRLFA